jgi:hypothetical protein
MFDFSITDSFQIPAHSFAMHRLPDQRPGIVFDMKGSGALERIENKPITTSTLPADTQDKQVRQHSIWQKILLSH